MGRQLTEAVAEVAVPPGEQRPDVPGSSCTASTGRRARAAGRHRPHREPWDRRCRAPPTRSGVETLACGSARGRRRRHRAVAVRWLKSRTPAARALLPPRRRHPVRHRRSSSRAAAMTACRTSRNSYSGRTARTRAGPGLPLVLIHAVNDLGEHLPELVRDRDGVAEVGAGSAGRGRCGAGPVGRDPGTGAHG